MGVDPVVCVGERGAGRGLNFSIYGTPSWDSPDKSSG